MNMVAEGVKTSRVVMELGRAVRRRHARSPARCSPSCHEGAPAAEAYRGLLGRNVRSEMHGMPGS